MNIRTLTLTGWLSLLLWLPLGAQEAVLRRPAATLPPGDSSALLAWAHTWTAGRLGDPAAGLELKAMRHSPAGWHFTLGQTQAGLPVFEAGLKVHTSPEGRVVSVLERLQPLPAARAAFTVAEATVRLGLGEALGATEVALDRGYLAQDGTLRPVYRALATGWNPAFSYEVYVDAATGAELSRRDAATYWRPPGDTTGWGRIFSPDPCTRAEQDYGVLFADSADAHQLVFDGLMDTVPLRGLTYRDSLFHLEGPHVHIVDRAAFFYPVATSSDGQFFFRRDETGFEDVMVYFHVDSFQRYVQRLGFDNLQNRPFPIDPHGLGNSDQSAFYENNGDPYILMGDGGVDDAEDADVIIHEYLHALSYAASPGSNSGLERRGLDEGIADYFTAAYSYDLSPWRWHELFNWDGHNEFWPGRMGVSSRMYPPTGSTSIYVYGEIWAATLMQIRQAIGDTVCDRVALAHLYTLYSGMTLPQAAQTFLDTDSLLYGNAHRAVLTNYFCERGLLNQVDCSAVGLPDLAPSLTWTWGPNPSPVGATLRVELPAGPGPWELTLFDAQGRLLGRHRLMAGVNYVPLSLPAGLYLGRLRAGSQDFGSRRLRIE